MGLLDFIRFMVGYFESPLVSIGDDIVPSMPAENINNCRFDLERLQERVLPAAILPTFINWEEDHVVDDLIGDLLPPDLVKTAKKEG